MQQDQALVCHAELFEPGDKSEAFYISTTTSGTTTTRTVTGFGSSQASIIPVYLPDEMKLIIAEAILRSNGSLS